MRLLAQVDVAREQLVLTANMPVQTVRLVIPNLVIAAVVLEGVNIHVQNAEKIPIIAWCAGVNMMISLLALGKIALFFTILKNIRNLRNRKFSC